MSVKLITGIWSNPSIACTKLNAKFKKMSDSRLLSALQELLHSSQKNSYNALHLANLALSELSIRRYGIENKASLMACAEMIQQLSDACMVKLNYAVELAGVHARCITSESSEKGLLRPYFRDKPVRDILGKWQNGKKDSLDEYACTDLSKIDKKYLQKASIQYLLPEEQERYLATFLNGEIRIANQAVNDGSYIFALDQDGEKLLVGKKRKGKFQHTSFFAGRPVQCAGVLQIVNGKIVLVELKSGHYHPQKRHGEYLRQFLSHPERLGESEAGSLPISSFENLVEKLPERIP